MEGQMLRALRMRVRSTVRWRRGTAPLPHEDKRALFAHLAGAEHAAALAVEADLARRFDLGPLCARSTCLVYRDNLALLEVLLRVAEGRDLGFGDTVRAVDVGAQDWRYAFALERFLRLHGRAPGEPPRTVHLTGVEVDGHVVYPDLHARCDVARAHAALTGNPRVRYEVADFRGTTHRAQDVVTLFFPFLVRPALRRWGLPDALFDPAGVLARACDAVRPGGTLFLLHQTAEERDVAFDLLAGLGARIVASVGAATRLVHDAHRTIDRFVTLAARP